MIRVKKFSKMFEKSLLASRFCQKYTLSSHRNKKCNIVWKKYLKLTGTGYSVSINDLLKAATTLKFITPSKLIDRKLPRDKRTTYSWNGVQV